MIKRSTHNWKTWSTIAVVALACVCAVWAAVLKPTSSGQDTAMILQNFAPLTPVSYHVEADNKTIFQGVEQTDGHGTITIPAPKLKAMAQNTLHYTLEFGAPKDTQKLRLILDRKNQSIRVKTDGFQTYQDIAIMAPGLELSTKTDWSGKLSHTAHYDFQSARNKPQEIKIAFAGGALNNMLPVQNPAIVKVLVADNDAGFITGGLPPLHSWTPDQFPNEHTRIFDEEGNPVTPLVGVVYEETYCGSPFLSVCLREEMAQQIHNIVLNFDRALMLMTEQFSAVMMQQVTSIGMFFDAKMHLETEREIQKRVAEAHKTYHPSDQMCRFGTFVRSVADTEERLHLNKLGFDSIMTRRYRATANTSTQGGPSFDMDARIRQFKTVYCDPYENGPNGLTQMCKNDDGTLGGIEERYNNDIDYVGVFDDSLTLDVDFFDPSSSPAEEDVIALARHLYWPNALSTETAKEIVRKKSAYLDFRSAMTTNTVAHNSFAHILAMKSSAASVDEEDGPDKGWYYMKNIIKEFGVSDEEEIDDVIGKYPSYYAQMEILTKKIYQDPDFYTNLYDKPENVERIGAAMDAIKLMHGRDRFEASLRREILTSLLLEQALEKHVKAVDAKLQATNARVGK